MANQDSKGVRYARRAVARVKPGEEENFLQAMRERVFPTIKKQVGLRRMYLLRNPNDPAEFISLTFWNKKFDADKYGSSAFANVVAGIREFLEGDVAVTEFEVEMHETNPEDLPLPGSAEVKIARSTRKSPISSKRRVGRGKATRRKKSRA